FTALTVGDIKYLVNNSNSSLFRNTPNFPSNPSLFLSGNLYFVNRKGEVVIQPGDYDAGEMDKLNGLLALRDNKTEKWGIFDVSTGKQVVTFKYDSIS
ncbi:WG repeat-containing protein, partial [Veillonella parvula]|uniref:WG repeat-containing protein n=1 Tax=Veillonella parvula TaxID=29466 RepID=UPI00210D492F